MRIGFCCKMVSPTGDAAEDKRCNVTTTTLAALRRLDRDGARLKLSAIMETNLGALRRQVEYVAGQPPLERALRISSDMFPAYGHPLGDWFYKDPGVRRRIADELARIGDCARRHDLRLSLHPGQFCVINSVEPATLDNALKELEYHADIMRWLGYGEGWHPGGAHINIHGGSRAGGVQNFRAGMARLSATARSLLTVENDEVSFGLDDLLPLAEDLPIVVDLHHHWIKSGGEYLQPDDPRLDVVRASWRGVRPMAHISVSREDLLVGHPADSLPDLPALAAQGIKARDLRAHSDRMWNEAVNDLVMAHLSWTDFEVEAKHKNLAVDDLARHIGRRLAVAPAA